MNINIANKKTHEPTIYDIYIGRGSVLGSNYTHLKNTKTKAEVIVDTREEAITLYKDWLLYQIKVRDKEVLTELANLVRLVEQRPILNLVCYCKPKACHGDVIKSVVEQLAKGIGYDKIK